MITVSRDIVRVSIKGNLPQEIKTHLIQTWGFIVPTHTVWSIETFLEEILKHSDSDKAKALAEEVKAAIEAPHFRYSLTSQNHSSTKYGPCEICHKPVSQVYSQTEERSYYNPIEYQINWAQQNTYFGHLECLEAIRKDTKSE